MKRLSPRVGIILAALALTACQAKAPAPAAEAAAPVDTHVAAAVSDVRAAVIDPATGKARDTSAVFAPQDSAGAPLPSGNLGDGNALQRNLQNLSPSQAK
ncbi:MAG: hypothetical protein EPN98_12220 [Phenylobacterium sp.]|uniref:hypothetical protein n=1 Tax=Phenylobacterium sp. TaxID=1871053 RepID=UPI001209DFCB|nr:hypothetical protein [Phenylobacterium sp.]TAL33124.1 MAG: hypothetical protein EPN98_12220 [Phenylobacterium sp.]